LKTASHGEDGKWAYSEIIKLRAENEALRKDAERYRWLREADFETEGIIEIGWGAHEYEHLIREELDATIDNAIKKDGA
jgi:hypothetical protein